MNESLRRVYGDHFAAIQCEQWERFVRREREIAAKPITVFQSIGWSPFNKPMPRCAFCGAIEFSEWVKGHPITLRPCMAATLTALGGNGSDHAHISCINSAIFRQAGAEGGN